MKKFLATSILIFAPFFGAIAATNLPVASNPMSDNALNTDEPAFKKFIEREEKADKIVLIYALINNTTPKDLRSLVTNVCKPFIESSFLDPDRQKALAQLSESHRNIINLSAKDVVDWCGDDFLVMWGTIVAAILNEEQLATTYNFYTSTLGKKWIRYRTTFGYTQNEPVQKAFSKDERDQISDLANNPAIKATETFFTDKIESDTDSIKNIAKISILALNAAISKYRRIDALAK